MNNEIIRLTTPVTEEDARNLALGDLVVLSGRVFTGRSRFHIRAIEEEIFPPIDYAEINCFFHSGPVIRRDSGSGKWEIVSIEPTSSIRFEKYGAAVVKKFRLRVLIGKTTMGPGTAEALKEVGGVHLSKIGICGNQIRQQVKEVEDVFFLDELGKTEATWIFRVEDFGPFFVDIDARGRNYFKEMEKKGMENITKMYRDLDIPADFFYTDVG